VIVVVPFAPVLGGASICHTFCVVVFFFFQAEDGIRDLTVTGVQTCALPISGWQPWVVARMTARWPRGASSPCPRPRRGSRRRWRSEERRVGKECRPRRCPWH